MSNSNSHPEAASARCCSAGALSVRLTGVTCRHGRRVVVDAVDLEVSAGEHVALLGTNGSGKTTLLRALLGLHRTVSGTIEIGGHVPNRGADWGRLRRQAAWIPQRQSPGSFPLLVRELLASSGRLPEAMSGAEALGVSHLADRPVATLSGGQLQRVFMARAVGCLAAGAGLLLADEPTAALDFEAQEAVGRMIAELPVTVLVVTHDPQLAGLCHRRVQMAAGRLRQVA